MNVFIFILAVICFRLFFHFWWKHHVTDRWRNQFRKLTTEQKRVRNWVQHKTGVDLNDTGICVTFFDDNPNQWVVLRQGTFHDDVIYRIDLTDEEMKEIIEKAEY